MKEVPEPINKIVDDVLGPSTQTENTGSKEANAQENSTREERETWQLVDEMDGAYRFRLAPPRLKLLLIYPTRKNKQSATLLVNTPTVPGDVARKDQVFNRFVRFTCHFIFILCVFYQSGLTPAVALTS